MKVTKAWNIDKRTILGKLFKELDNQVIKSTWISDYNLTLQLYTNPK